MIDIEKKLKNKLITKEQSDDKKEKRKQKLAEVGTKKIVYLLLKKIVERKEYESIRIVFNTYKDKSKGLYYLNQIVLNGKSINLNKTFVDVELIKSYFENYFKVSVIEDFVVFANDLSFVYRYFPDSLNKYLQKYKNKSQDVKRVKLIGNRKKVCEYLCGLNDYNLNEKEHCSELVRSKTK